MVFGMTDSAIYEGTGTELQRLFKEKTKDDQDRNLQIKVLGYGAHAAKNIEKIYGDYGVSVPEMEDVSLQEMIMNLCQKLGITSIPTTFVSDMTAPIVFGNILNLGIVIPNNLQSLALVLSQNDEQKASILVKFLLTQVLCKTRKLHGCLHTDLK